jgi:hypothetical protein
MHRWTPRNAVQPPTTHVPGRARFGGANEDRNQPCCRRRLRRLRGGAPRPRPRSSRSGSGRARRRRDGMPAGGRGRRGSARQRAAARRGRGAPSGAGRSGHDAGLRGRPGRGADRERMLRGSSRKGSSPTHRATCSWCASPMEGALSRQPEREPHRLRLECSVCGYGAARAVPPERCPMCQREGTWKEARLVVRPHGRDG